MTALALPLSRRRDPLPVARTSGRSDATVEEEERTWILRARRGDRDAFRHLVDRYRDPVYETALRIVRSREDAEEVAQDAFVRAWRALDGFRGESRFSTWLYRIATRCALDAAERVRKRRGREVGAEPEAIEAFAAPAPPETDRLRLERVLGELDPLPRAVVTLHYLRDRPVDEIAEILGLPAGTVKTHLHRSRARMRAVWMRLEAKGGTA